MAEYSSKTEDGKCIFCEIVAGNIKTPGIFWEDEEFMAFLSIDPNTEGFSCVIPKKHFESDVLKMPDESLQKFIIAAKKVSGILENYFDDVGRVGMIVEGMGVNHAHIKLIPMHGTQAFKNGGWAQILSGKQFWFDKYEGWISSGSGPMMAEERLKNLADKIRTSIN